MFVGHLAVSLIAKRLEPRISLGTWILAAMLADLLTFPLIILGIENFRKVHGVKLNRMVGQNIAYSHSLLMLSIWAALFAGIYFLRRHYARGAWLLFAVVISHWLLDVVSHRPDMPLAPGTQTRASCGHWA